MQETWGGGAGAAQGFQCPVRLFWFRVGRFSAMWHDRKVRTADTDIESDPIFDTPTDEASELTEDVAERAEIAAGQYVRHEEVVKWLESWGSPNELPYPVLRAR